MIADEYSSEDDDDGPIDVLERYFEAREWAVERVGDDEVVATAPGSWAQYEVRGVWREADRVLQFLALPGLVNEQLWLGHFELWSSNGMLLFRHAAIIDQAAETGLTSDAAATLIEAAIDECERFYPVFQFVLWGGKAPGEAIAAALIETHGEA